MALLYTVFGFVAVGQDQRGTGLSGGDYCFWQVEKPQWGIDVVTYFLVTMFSHRQVQTMAQTLSNGFRFKSGPTVKYSRLARLQMEL